MTPLPAKIVVLVVAIIMRGLNGNPGLQVMEIPMPPGVTVEECQTQAIPVIQERILGTKTVDVFGIGCAEFPFTKVGNA